MEDCQAKLILIFRVQDEVRSSLNNALTHAKVIYLENPTVENEKIYCCIKTYCEEIYQHVKSIPKNSSASDVMEIIERVELK
ncbi:hypothetical protein [Burkholderia cepacia]|uniref:Uncharacterized protein n=2 Tax=Burkholderia cepacia TaxID=292 RepID=A0A8I1AUG5_BURCE|nr:hypothetical protein [Burkholderia cepacia]MBH9685243.1 hypothetical protein [Burkholderia cepacia]MBH9697968.1 hypothetical protein [Burkholderia cepacia]MBH9733543.1 hypothetical protein [Burkholderia cepacia]MBX3759910.1 hypothetical protein [Burkholderia cepacia]MBX3799161.1 hypothetical protein [Burkholderia cepacia]